MPNCRDHGSTHPCHRADERFLGKRQQVFHRATAASDDDDVHVLVSFEPLQRGDHLGHGIRALHRGINHFEAHGWPPLLGDTQHVAFRGRTPPGHQPDLLRQKRGSGLQTRVEEPLGAQRPLQLLNACQQLAYTNLSHLGHP